jgi:DNA-binding transcriptional MerR regulator
MADQVVIPDDQEQFKLNEVCKLANVQPYMLRFWGTEFPQLEAAKSGTGQRLYSREQVAMILEIRHLLFDEGLTIAGARKKLAMAAEAGGAQPKPAPPRPKPAAREEVEEVAEEPEAAEVPPAPRSAATTTSSARRGAAARTPPPATAEVDKQARKHVQPLLATLKTVRDEIDKIVAELKGE